MKRFQILVTVLYGTEIKYLYGTFFEHDYGLKLNEDTKMKRHFFFVMTMLRA